MNKKLLIALFALSMFFSSESMANMVCTGEMTFSYNADGYTVTFSDGYVMTCSNNEWSQECDSLQDNLSPADFFAAAMIPFGASELGNAMTFDSLMASASGSPTPSGTEDMGDNGGSSGGSSETLPANTVKNSDGSYTVYDDNGNIVGFKNKRIYTIEEVSAIVKDTGNTIRLRYK